jgi:hypothetical protein
MVNYYPGIQKVIIILCCALMIFISYGMLQEFNNPFHPSVSLELMDNLIAGAQCQSNGSPGNFSQRSDQRIIWGTGFEKSDPRLWIIEGGFIRQGAGSYYLFTPLAHRGKFSIGLTIDTNAESESGSHAAYLFSPFQLIDEAYYYSAWYYIPGGVNIGSWWNIWQWKSTYNGKTGDSKPVFVIGILQQKGKNYLYLRDILNPDINDSLLQEELPVPTDQWFQIEAYYMKSRDDSGKIIVWQDGVEIFNLSNITTSLADNTVLWSVNNYTDTLTPNPYTIYVDDIAISRERLGAGS